VSTGTKNLQEQIFFKDLPALARALPVPFTATLMKGRSNYLCLHRWEMYRDGVEGTTSAGGRLIESGDEVLLPILKEWASQTTTGDRAELKDLPEDLPMWKGISAEAESCLGSTCPRFGDCFVTLMRQRALESDVVIVNHHLLCADAAVRQSAFGEVGPVVPTLVVDEAHQLEDVATQYFGVAFSNFRVDDLVRDGERLLSSMPRDVDDLARGLHRVADRSRTFFASLSGSFRLRETAGERRDGRGRYSAEAMQDYFEDGMMLAGALEGLEATLALATRQSANGPNDSNAPNDPNELASSIQRRAGELRSDLRFLMRADDPEFVYYAGNRGRGSSCVRLPSTSRAPCRDALFKRFRSVVLTSATLAWMRVLLRQGTARLREADGSARSVRVRFPNAGAALPAAPNAARRSRRRLPKRQRARAIELLKRSRGRRFVLFTSYACCGQVQQFVEMALDYPILVQGSAPRSVLIDQFDSTPNSVLLATVELSGRAWMWSATH
jgi:ATP-dependent DNA helicase DinG